ncbi:hypothetical protein FKW77_003998 [Venturia effusa]|uniref:Uncharacterized protein n=1 Tax=Venturia effusa TaxID=50376 RepID=A0A517LNQ6_9PEZI|nr:hypothetical protein FKW77_003998 [Venturia effusa]
MSYSDTELFSAWADALHENLYTLPPSYSARATTAPMAIPTHTHSSCANPNFALEEYTCTDVVASKCDAILLSSAFSPSYVNLPTSQTSSSDFSPSSSEEGAEFLFGWAESRRERRHVNRELKKNTKLNNGMYSVKEMMAIFRQEEECGFCFGEDSDESEEEEDESDEELFDGGEREGSEDSDSLCGDGEDHDADESSVGQGEGEDMSGDEEMGEDNQSGEDEDGEMERVVENCKKPKRKLRKSVSWKEDEELAEIRIVEREDLSMDYVFGQERAMMMKEDGTSKFATKKAITEKAAAVDSTTKATRANCQRIDPSQQGEPYVFGQQQATATKAHLPKPDSQQEKHFASKRQRTTAAASDTRNITIAQSPEAEEAFVFGQKSGSWKKEPKFKLKPKPETRTSVTVVEVEPETIAPESEEAFVFGKQPGVWSQS